MNLFSIINLFENTVALYKVAPLTIFLLQKSFIFASESEESDSGALIIDIVSFIANYTIFMETIRLDAKELKHLYTVKKNNTSKVDILMLREFYNENKEQVERFIEKVLIFFRDYLVIEKPKSFLHILKNLNMLYSTFLLEFVKGSKRIKEINVLIKESKYIDKRNIQNLKSLASDINSQTFANIIIFLIDDNKFFADQFCNTLVGKSLCDEEFNSNDFKIRISDILVKFYDCYLDIVKKIQSKFNLYNDTKLTSIIILANKNKTEIENLIENGNILTLSHKRKGYWLKSIAFCLQFCMAMVFNSIPLQNDLNIDKIIQKYGLCDENDLIMFYYTVINTLGVIVRALLELKENSEESVSLSFSMIKNNINDILKPNGPVEKITLLMSRMTP